jgi:hypothetical protein
MQKLRKRSIGIAAILFSRSKSSFVGVVFERP